MHEHSPLWSQVERGLELIKAKKIKLYDDHGAENGGKKRKVPDYPAYCESAWGVKTRGYVALAKKLDKPKQNLIMTAGVSTIDLSSVDDEDGEDGVADAAKDPRAFLEIWYVFFSIFSSYGVDIINSLDLNR